MPEMADDVELKGTPECPIYRLRYHGGPCDGQVVNSFRPYDQIRHEDGHIYRAEHEGEKCLVWAGDNTYDIDLYHAGKAK
jgi:hypothetical protein